MIDPDPAGETWRASVPADRPTRFLRLRVSEMGLPLREGK